jgi:hypothetical protein
VTWIKVSNDRDEKFNGTLKRRIIGGKDTSFVIDSLGECVIYLLPGAYWNKFLRT